MRALLTLPMPTGRAVIEVIPALLAAVRGAGAALHPVGPGTAAAATTLDDDPADPVGLAVATSGSTGRARPVLLPGSALMHAAVTGQQRLGPSGSWLLALPGQHIAGLMVLLRSGLARQEPAVLDTTRSFTVRRFVAVCAALPAGPTYVSLVPTQLSRLLADPEGRRTLRTFTAVLVGGAAAAPSLLSAAADARVNLVVSYGMTETCGGCFYDGVPLPRVSAVLDDTGRVVIRGPVVAAGYLGKPFGAPFSRDPDGTRSVRTGDLGAIDADGRLRILGRADDVIVSGGVNVAPQPVEAALSQVAGVAQIAVTAVPDREWGQAVVAVVVVDGVAPTLEALRTAAAPLGRAAAPRHLVLVEALPLIGIGKLDRVALAAMAAAAIGDQDS